MATWDPRANDLFLQALELPSDAARAEFLGRACAGDTSLRAQVESLLEASDRAGSFLERPAARPGLTEAGTPLPAALGGPPEGPGTVVGPYRLVEALGE